MKTLKLAAIGLLAAVLFTGCCDCNKKTVNYPFEDTMWELTQLDGKKVKTDNNFYVVFSHEGRINGKGACNTFFGPWEKAAGKENGLKVGNLASTMMACLNNMASEADFFKAVESATEYRMDRGNLYLYEGTKLLAVFQGSNKRLK